LGGGGKPVVTVADFSGDGHPDFLGSSPNGRDMSADISQGRGFASTQLLRATPFGLAVRIINPVPLVTGDLNADGIADAVLLCQDPSGAWMLQTFLMGVLR
jgi:hypothetical protein